MSKGKLKLDHPVVEKFQAKIDSGEKILKKNKKGVCYGYFHARFKEVHGYGYVSVSIPGDLRLLGTFLDSVDTFMLLEMIEHYISSYHIGFKSQKFPKPRIAGMKYQFDILHGEVQDYLQDGLESDSTNLSGVWANG